MAEKDDTPSELPQRHRFLDYLNLISVPKYNCPEEKVFHRLAFERIKEFVKNSNIVIVTPKAPVPPVRDSMFIRDDLIDLSLPSFSKPVEGGFKTLPLTMEIIKRRGGSTKYSFSRMPDIKGD